MTSYWDDRFLRHLNKKDIKLICEVGARYGDESIMLSNVFTNANILSFECNPNTVISCMDKLKEYSRIQFFPHGLGKKEEILPFYSYILDNDGASSLHKRIDCEDTQELTGYIYIKRLESILNQEYHVDLLCMDIQGHELEVLKGAGSSLKNIKYIIMEEPKPVINTMFLPEGVHSKYINTPTSQDIKEYMSKHNFIEIERLSENMIEDNVMYKNTAYGKKKLFNIDLHISVIADIKDIFKRINPDLEIIDWSLSGHTWVFNKERTDIKYLNNQSWLHLDKELIDNFNNEYDLSEYDGFIVCHPNSFVMLYEKYNKPVFVINSCRYDLPFCYTKDISMLNELHNCFKRLQDKNLLHVISNNLADNSYFKLGNPDIHTKIIPSLCLYTNMKWNSNTTSNKFLLYSGNIERHDLIIEKALLGQNYKWDTLMNFRGIIHIPYEASTMSIFEQLSSGIPLFFPSKEFLKFLWKNGHHKGVNYWGIPPPYLEKTLDDSFWIDQADYNTIEGVYYFNSFEELFSMIEDFNDYKYNDRIAFINKRIETVCNEYSKYSLIAPKHSVSTDSFPS